jgi:hypothetical protein
LHTFHIEYLRLIPKRALAMMARAITVTKIFVSVLETGETEIARDNVEIAPPRSDII